MHQSTQRTGKYSVNLSLKTKKPVWSFAANSTISDESCLVELTTVSATRSCSTDAKHWSRKCSFKAGHTGQHRRPCRSRLKLLLLGYVFCVQTIVLLAFIALCWGKNVWFLLKLNFITQFVNSIQSFVSFSETKSYIRIFVGRLFIKSRHGYRRQLVLSGHPTTDLTNDILPNFLTEQGVGKSTRKLFYKMNLICELGLIYSHCTSHGRFESSPCIVGILAFIFDASAVRKYPASGENGSRPSFFTISTILSLFGESSSWAKVWK